MPVTARADILGALITHLRSFPELTALVSSAGGWLGTGSGPRISGERQGGQNGWRMPTRAVTLRKAGGAPDPDYALGRESSRIEVTCYGATGIEANQVAGMVHAILVPRQGERPAAFTLLSCRIDDIEPEAGAASIQDPDVVWESVWRPYHVTWWSLS